FRGWEPRNVEKRISLDEVSIVSKDQPPLPTARTISTRATLPMGEKDPHRGHLAHGRGRPAPRSPRPWARTTRTEVTSRMGEDDPHRGHLAHGRGPTYCLETVHPRLTRTDHLALGRGPSQHGSPCPWARTIRTEVTSPMGEDDPHLGHLAHGRGQPAPRPPRPWARTTRTEVTSPMGKDDPHRGHLAHGRGRPAPRSPRPWERTDL
ncbi:hypothetical protein HID58_087230, partial [Brassica napus]